MNAANDKPMFGPDASPADLDTVRIGAHLPYFEPGKKGIKIKSCGEQNKNRKVLNALLNFRFFRTDDQTAREGFQASDSGFALILRNGSSSGNGGASGTIATALQLVFGDYLQCVSYDESTGLFGTDPIVVAKEWLHRNSLASAVIADQLHTYSYNQNIFDTNGICNALRFDNYPDGVETQEIIPRWRYHEIIYATAIPPVTVGGTIANFLISGRSCQWTRV